MKLEAPPSNWNSGPWKEISRNDGIRLVEIETFEDFSKFVNLGFGGFDSEHIWRGQRDSSWEVCSTLSRTNKEPLSHLSNFSNAISRFSNVEFDLSSENPRAEKERLKLWSLGQHYGLHTPLIDWTIYPYAALFFAFVDSHPSTTGHRAIYSLSWHEIQSVNFHIVQTDEMLPLKETLKSPPYPKEFKEFLFKKFGFWSEEGKKMLENSAIPDHIKDRIIEWHHENVKKKRLRISRGLGLENQRIHCQGGLHLYNSEDISIEEWLRKNLKHISHPVLTKILMPESERKETLRSLNKMNVNFLTLFPDIEGAAKHCNLAHAESNYPGIREY